MKTREEGQGLMSAEERTRHAIEMAGDVLQRALKDPDVLMPMVANDVTPEAISAVRGSDPRTVQKWLRTFHKMDLIKPVTSASWEIM